MTKSKKKTAKTAKKQSFAEIAEAIVNKPNIRKYGFPKDGVKKVVAAIARKNGGTFDVDGTLRFAAGYCNESDGNFDEVDAIIRLMLKHRPDECVVTRLAKGRKILILGEVAAELFRNVKIDWNEAHVSLAGVKVPLKLNLSAKMKCFKGDSIEREISRNNKNTNKNKNNKKGK